MASTPTSQITRNVTSSITPANATSTGAKFSVTSYLVQGATDITARLEKETVLVNHIGGAGLS